MQCYITYCIKGFFAFTSENELITKRLFPEDKIIHRLAEIDDKKIIKEELDIINSLDNYDEIIIESNKKLSDYNNPKIKIQNPNQAGEYLRNNYKDFNLDNTDVIDIYQKLAIYKIKKESSSEDKHLIQAINSIDEIDDTISKLIERIREWYALYFPEMETIKNNETYISLISKNKTKEKIIEAKPDAFVNINDELEDDINSDDLEIMNDYANSIYNLQKSRKKIENYIDEKMDSIAPNLKILVGSTLGAKLISHAGGVKRLSMYPSSTVQIMGAEKALFRHLKSGDNPPKYGLIYQHPQIRSAKWWNRGKIARALASQISLATRRDVFSDNIDEDISNEFAKRVMKIEKDNPFPTKTTKRRNEEKSKKKKRKNKKRKKGR